MAAERSPRGLWIALVIGGVLLIGLGIAVPGSRSDELRQAPAVDMDKIGVEARIAHTQTDGIEGELAHIEAHRAVEASVFSTPGGQYTAADVRLNGPLSPSERFKGIVSVHDMRPERGTPVCPITRTKANPKFVWSVGGKRYTFCCPPCIEEWTIRAKKAKAPLPSPESFAAR